MQTVRGTLFDFYVTGSEARLWVITEDGRRVMLRHAFRPRVYVSGDDRILARLRGQFERKSLVFQTRRTEKIEFWSGETIPVHEFEIPDAKEYKRLSGLLPDFDGPLRIFNADLPLDQYYAYESGLFPCGVLEAEVEEGFVQKIQSLDSPWDDFALPELSVIRMEALGGGREKHHFRGLRIWWEGQAYEVEGNAPKLIFELNRFIERADPDLIFTGNGDSFLFPWFLRMAHESGLPLKIDRDPAPPERALRTEGRSYFSYGRIMYSPPRYPLYGRWHIDTGASFMHAEADLEGVVEIARIAKLPVQVSARTSPGTAISSMQLDWAVQDGILIPWRKGEPEHFKSPWTLFVADKGGLTYTPPVGAYEQVAEIDFASMYPAIMVRHNISPETVLCPCCQEDGIRVPEIGYHICRKRHGLVPRTLAPLLERRLRYKTLRKTATTPEERERYDHRQNAIKWALVTCFGYLGYKNARFGKVEAHEAVTAYGREALLQAKETAEGRGYRMLHALTDSMWLEGGSMAESVLEGLCDEITAETGILMSLEGVYRWLHFLPSRQRKGVGVPNRYFGVFEDGTLKARGIMARRRDTPAYVKDAQRAVLNVLLPARDLAEYQTLIPEARQEAERWKEELREGNVSSSRLILSRQLTREVRQYKVDNWTSLAARQLRDAGVKLQVGERFGVLVRNRKDPHKESRVRPAALLQSEDVYDVELYEEILERALKELSIEVEDHLSCPLDCLLNRH